MLTCVLTDLCRLICFMNTINGDRCKLFYTMVLFILFTPQNSNIVMGCQDCEVALRWMFSVKVNAVHGKKGRLMFIPVLFHS